MNRLHVFCLLFLLSFTTIFANPEKAQRISDDSKIIGFLVLKEPATFYNKFLKLSNAIYPGSSAAIEQNVAPVKNILDSATSIGVVLYSKDNFHETPSVGVYITVKDKGVFQNPILGLAPSKEVVDNTLVVSVDGQNLPKFKEFQKKLSAVKTQNDLEVFFDITNIVKLNDLIIKEKMPYAKPIFAQMEMATIKINLTDTGIESTSGLITTDKSNLQTALTQPAANSTDLLKITGIGNFATSIANYDMSKAKSFTKDLFLMANNIPELKDEEKKYLKELEVIALESLSIDAVESVSTMSFKDIISSKYLLKLKDPTLILNKSKNFFTKLSDATFSQIMNKTELKDTYEFKWEDSEKYNGLQIYKISSVSKEKEAEIAQLIPMPTDQFIAADATYVYSATSLESIKELINSSKTPSKEDVKLFSKSHFKDGSSCYMDFYLVGYVKLFEKLANTFGLKLDSMLSLKLPPVKMAITLDGNFAFKAQIDTTTIAALVQKAMELMNSSSEPLTPDDQPKSQP